MRWVQVKAVVFPFCDIEAQIGRWQMLFEGINKGLTLPQVDRRVIVPMGNVSASQSTDERTLQVL